MPISEYVRNESSKWNIRRMFRENYGDPDTLADLGVKDDTMERIVEALRSVWADNVPRQPSGDVPEARAADLQ
eukprot:3939480-Rhodomonas_salina.1